MTTTPHPMDWLAGIPSLVIRLEKLYPQAGLGAKKLATVIVIADPVLSPEMLGEVKPYVSAVVDFYNTTGYFTKGEPLIPPPTT